MVIEFCTLDRLNSSVLIWTYCCSEGTSNVMLRQPPSSCKPKAKVRIVPTGSTEDQLSGQIVSVHEFKK